MKHIYTESEGLFQSNLNLYQIGLSISRKLFTLDDIADILPCHLHLNHKKDIRMYYLNKMGQDYYGDYWRVIEQQGVKAIQNIIHPSTTLRVLPKLHRFVKTSGTGDIIRFTQFVRRNPTAEYECFITTTGFYEPDDSLISISHAITCVDELAMGMDKLIRKENFYSDNFCKFNSLTKREKQILKLIAEGKTNKDIADLLFISKLTVKTHRQNILRKLETCKITDLVKYSRVFQN